MSDTPRTDAAAIRCACSTYVVPTEFAQQLEKELRATWEAFLDLAKNTGELRDKWDKLEQELKEANYRLDVKRAEANHYKAETERLRKASDGWDDYNSIKLLQRENAELRELVSTLGAPSHVNVPWEKWKKMRDDNTALRATLEQCEEALEHAFIFGAFSDEARRQVRCALDAARKEAQP